MEFGNPPDIIRNPPKSWAKRLIPDSVVWLVKENTYAMVTWPFRRSTGVCGRLCIQIHPGVEQTWYVSEDGKGLDGKPLMLPCHPLPETEAPLANDEHVYSELASLRSEVNRLRKMVMYAAASLNGLHIPVFPQFETVSRPHKGNELWDVIRGDTDGSFIGTVEARTIDEAYEKAREKWWDVPPNEYDPNEELVIKPHREGRN